MTMHRAIRASLQPQQTTSTVQPVMRVAPRVTAVDNDLEMALELSRVQVSEDERRRLQEEEELQKVLQLSLMDK